MQVSMLDKHFSEAMRKSSLGVGPGFVRDLAWSLDCRGVSEIEAIFGDELRRLAGRIRSVRQSVLVAQVKRQAVLDSSDNDAGRVAT